MDQFISDYKRGIEGKGELPEEEIEMVLITLGEKIAKLKKEVSNQVYQSEGRL
jgi:hypothetical protein